MDSTLKPDPQYAQPSTPSSTDAGPAPVPKGSPTMNSTPPAAAQRPAGGETLARAAQGVHHVVDATVAKVAPLVDGVHDKVEAAKNAASSTQEWVGAAREAIQARPFAAIAGALLVGAAYMSLRRR